MRIAFFGTPSFAVPSLRALIGEGFQVVAVVTQPDRPQNRSRSRVHPPPVKIEAEEEGIPVYQPENPNTAEFVAQFAALDIDLGVVVAYGHILKPDVLSIPGRGMINVHASLLPEFRGAAPIQHAILNGCERTGITIMQMSTGMDSGPILHQVETAVNADETAGELAEKLSELGALALIEGLALIACGGVQVREQDDALATYAPKIDRVAARLDWSRSAADIARHIRAMDPAPGAWTTYSNDTVKLFGASPDDSAGEAGTVLDLEDRMLVAAGSGAVAILDAQPAGRTRMTAAAWCRGAGPKIGERLE